jgi:hypothetical protein
MKYLFKRKLYIILFFLMLLVLIYLVLWFYFYKINLIEISEFEKALNDVSNDIKRNK